MKNRFLIGLIILLSALACNRVKDKSMVQNARLELLPEPDKDLREEHNKQLKESLQSSTSDMEYMGNQLILIREKLKPLLNRKDWTSVNKRKIDTKKGIGKAEYYSLYGKLRKIKLSQSTDSIKRFVDFYLDNDSLILVFEQKTEDYELKSDPENYEPFKDSLFIYNGELIRIKSNMDCGAPFAEEYLKEEEVRLQAEFEKLVERIKN